MYSQEQIIKNNRYLSDLFWKPLKEAAEKRNGEINNFNKGNHIKSEIQCCRCKQIFKKAKMILHIYKINRFKGRGYRTAFVKKYYCKECESRFRDKPREK